jgi:serine/threonine protein kinase/tetratricopeptide (TPR) repeat protein
VTPERWVRVQELFAAALELPPAARLAFVVEASGEDLELKRDVETLLDSHEAATEGFLKSPSVDQSEAPHQALEPKSRLGPYEILGRLGSGGMGEVYRARDRKLDRDVAIKVLPAHLSANPAALTRFEREAKAVAALSHPNILSIFDFGTQGGTAYAVTELLEGETLRSKVEPGALAPRQAVDYALQIARGLAAAHERGVVHRDLKPENVFVSKDGHVKILDFGLAKREEKVAPGEETTAPTVSGETEPGTVLGTVGYMSPEQVRAIPADSRSDLFSFGAILFEMLSGKRAFRRDSAGDTMAAILRDDPPPLPSDIPESLDRVVRHCLEKDRDNRFQSARDVIFALGEPASAAPSAPLPLPTPSPRPPRRSRRTPIAVAVALLALGAATLFLVRSRKPAESPTAVSPAPTKTRVVVLPFANLGTADDAYVAAGLTEELIGRLANVRNLSVISRATAIGYDRQGKTAPQIGADLNVEYVLEGTVRPERVGGKTDRVRIAAELIKVADDTPIFSERYSRPIADIFAIQSDLADKSVKAMGVELVAREKTALDAAFTNDSEAYDLYLKGLQFVHAGQTHRNLEAAARHFQAAVERDPRFAQALNQLVRAELFSYFMFYDRSPAILERAKGAVDQLQALGPDLPDTHIARAFYHYWGRSEYPRAIEEFRKALALQPSNTDAISGTGMVLARMGRWKEAVPLDASWVALDPQSSQAWGRSGQTFILLGRYDDADAAFRKASQFNPKFNIPWALRVRGAILKNGDAQTARAIAAEAWGVAGLQDDSARLTYETFQALLCGGDFAGALRHLERDPRDHNTPFFAYPVELVRAQTHALSGDSDSAKRSFEEARKKLEKSVTESPDDSRFQSALGIALAGLGHTEEALAAATKGVEMMPESRDAWRALFRSYDLALVEAMLGRTDSAIDRLDDVLSKCGEFSAPLLRVDPRWAPLKTNPKFQQLLDFWTSTPSGRRPRASPHDGRTLEKTFDPGSRQGAGDPGSRISCAGWAGQCSLS